MIESVCKGCGNERVPMCPNCNDHAAALAAMTEEWDKRGDAMVALNNARVKADAAVLRLTAERDVLRAECEAWREWFAWKCGNGNQSFDVTGKLIEARAATDAAGALKGVE